MSFAIDRRSPHDGEFPSNCLAVHQRFRRYRSRYQWRDPRGKVFGDQSGLCERILCESRDLMPTTGDVRRASAWALRGMFRAVERAGIEGRVFPGLDMSGDPGVML